MASSSGVAKGIMVDVKYPESFKVRVRNKVF
jgi:hypothetical protein